MWSEQTIALIHAACVEDLGDAGDITSALLPARTQAATARIAPREAGVICGLALIDAILAVFGTRLGQTVTFEPAQRGSVRWQDGDPVEPGDVVGTLRGPAAAVLAIERTLLNFLGRMSGVATHTRRHVDAARAGNPDVQVLDTRKTLPGWRELDKYAVRAGGGTNHRHGLYDAILIKDNHLAGVGVERLAGTLFDMLNRKPPQTAFVEVEVDTLEQLREVCKIVGVDIVLLDNFPLDDLRRAVDLRDELGLRGKLALEASGGVTLDTIGDIAATGVDRISVGALTHAARWLDIGLDRDA